MSLYQWTQGIIDPTAGTNVLPGQTVFEPISLCFGRARCTPAFSVGAPGTLAWLIPFGPFTADLKFSSVDLWVLEYFSNTGLVGAGYYSNRTPISNTYDLVATAGTLRSINNANMRGRQNFAFAGEQTLLAGAIGQLLVATQGNNSPGTTGFTLAGLPSNMNGFYESLGGSASFPTFGAATITINNLANFTPWFSFKR